MGLTDDEKVTKEVFRMLYCVREPGPRGDLLEQLLNGFDKNDTNVKKIHTFARLHFDPKGGDVLPRILAACEDYLRVVMTPKDFEDFMKPEPAPKLGGILEELGSR